MTKTWKDASIEYRQKLFNRYNLKESIDNFDINMFKRNPKKFFEQTGWTIPQEHFEEIVEALSDIANSDSDISLEGVELGRKGEYIQDIVQKLMQTDKNFADTIKQISEDIHIKEGKIARGMAVALASLAILASASLGIKQLSQPTPKTGYVQVSKEDELRRVVPKYTYGSYTLYTPQDEWGNLAPSKSYLEIKTYINEQGSIKGTNSSSNDYLYLTYIKSSNTWSIVVVDNLWPQPIKQIEIWDDQWKKIAEITPSSYTDKVSFVSAQLTKNLKNKDKIKIKVISRTNEVFGIEYKFGYDEKIEWWINH